MTLDEVAGELRRLSTLLDKGVAALRELGQQYAQAEHDYRMSRAAAWLEAGDGTVPERQAWVDGKCADLRMERDLAEHERQTALEAVRSRRQQLSAWQSMAAAHRAEVEMHAYAQEPR